MSRSTNKLILLSVASLLAGALAESAQAQVVINGAGSSAGRQFAGGAPIAMCLNAPRPIHLRSGADDTSSSRHTWICNVTGGGLVNQPSVIRYSASESGDGYTKLNTANNQAPYILDTSTCGAPVVRTVSGITFDEYSNCTQQSNQLVHFGASDVQNTSFGQSGPSGNTFPNPNPVDVVEPVVALPFSLFVNNGVRLQTPAGGLGGQLENLSRPQIEAIFRRNPRDWNDLGYLVTSDGTTVNAAESGITLCLREAGSGSAAAFDQTQMLQSAVAVVTNNTVNGTGGSVIYSPTSTGVVNCIRDNVNGIGYLNSESVVLNAHPIQINGYQANYSAAEVAGNTSPIARKRDIACGRYDFWTKWVLTRMNTLAGQQLSLFNAFRDASKNEVNNVPSGSHWVALSDSATPEMNVDKGSDAGPISFLGGLNVPSNPECRP